MELASGGESWKEGLPLLVEGWSRECERWSSPGTWGPAQADGRLSLELGES